MITEHSTNFISVSLDAEQVALLSAYHRGNALQAEHEGNPLRAERENEKADVMLEASIRLRLSPGAATVPRDSAPPTRFNREYWQRLCDPSTWRHD